MDQYATAKRTLDAWLERSVLVPDDPDTIYVYEQEFDIAGVTLLRRGFISLVRLDRDRILTHEETRKKAKADREQLISTLKTYTSLIFGLYEDKKNEIEEVLASSHKDCLYNFVDGQSVRNRFYRMTGKGQIDQLISLMETRNIYIADGHHRLDVSYRLQVPYAPFYLSNMYSRGAVILPYHRTVNFKRERRLDELLGLLEPYATIVKIPARDGESLAAILGRVDKSDRLSFAIYSRDDLDACYVATQTKPYAAYESASIHHCLKELKVNIIHTAFIKGILGMEDDEISFTQDHNQAIENVRQGSLDAAFFLPATTVEEVKHIADNSLYMPPKSTFFYPKILTGLVFYRYA